MTLRVTITAAISLVLLAACGDDDVILPGDRFDIRGQAVLANESRPVALPAAQMNADWTHRNGSPGHTITHPALGADLSPLFSVDIGEGDSRRARITSHPVVANGIIYTIDSRALVTATNVDGRNVWTRDLTPTRDNATDASGGGISVGGGRVFVTTGFGEITALDAATGAEIWVQDLDAPAHAAPTLQGDLVYVVARDSTAWALDVTNGRIRWQRSGAPSTANFAGGASPAVSGEYVVFPFPSGEVLATYPRGGLTRWSSVVTGDRLGNASGVINDISGDPVIVGNRVYIGNFGGRTAAFDLRGGARLWTATEGSLSPVWVVGDAVFLISDNNALVRLDANTGAPVWRVALPVLEEGANPRSERRFFTHYGPVIAGGRLIVTSSDGQIRQFDPASGASLGQLALPGGAASGPVVAGQTLYVLSKDGQLHAFR
ncbi:Outer membrane protein assembly factor BamB, contains PQQ-like beta-propeller repeat [Yoonia rosea]|uniref:Outer membrane protein assembly factor BamB, contains PQQ-like beta-propeller repeat n=1 Tax=Yoonia rosea TaxID=287098 RepID=A0A1R3WUG8_9RHOB|nr:PQQ-like beta-propeller repeat protein [Yoonia rosea]SIT80412.1 Outer membrane protein assembly factor BamB, contains PQQ-like beta-propeller repeat [Yoonia rosea]